MDRPYTHRGGRFGLRDRRFLTVAGVAFALIAAAIAIAVALGTCDRADYPTSEDGESLIVLAPFANYTGGEQGFNVPGPYQGRPGQ